MKAGSCGAVGLDPPLSAESAMEDNTQPRISKFRACNFVALVALAFTALAATAVRVYAGGQSDGITSFLAGGGRTQRQQQQEEHNARESSVAVRPFPAPVGAVNEGTASGEDEIMMHQSNRDHKSTGVRSSSSSSGRAVAPANGGVALGGPHEADGGGGGGRGGAAIASVQDADDVDLFATTAEQENNNKAGIMAEPPAGRQQQHDHLQQPQEAVLLHAFASDGQDRLISAGERLGMFRTKASLDSNSNNENNIHNNGNPAVPESGAIGVGGANAGGDTMVASNIAEGDPGAASLAAAATAAAGAAGVKEYHARDTTHPRGSTTGDRPSTQQGYDVSGARDSGEDGESRGGLDADGANLEGIGKQQPRGEDCPAFLELRGNSEISTRRIWCDADTMMDSGYDIKSVAVQGDTLHVYAPGEATRALLAGWGFRLPTLTYKWGGVRKEGLRVVVHEEELEESMCHSRWRGVSFYYVPHFRENVYHLHNDNIVAVASNVLGTPCLCHGSKVDSCTRYQTNLIQLPPLNQHQGHTNAQFLQLFHDIFNSTVQLGKSKGQPDLAPSAAQGGLLCLDHMVWGYTKPYYTDCYDDRSSATEAWRHYALQRLGIDAGPPSVEAAPVTPPSANGTQPRVIFLHRTHTTTGPRSHRYMADVGPLRRAFAAEGLHMAEWEYTDHKTLKGVLGSLTGYDIYVGVHGAQLVNTMYGAPGLVLVEVATEGRPDQKVFTRVAQGRRGGYIKLRMYPKTEYQVDDAMAATTVSCALALWRRDSNGSTVCEAAAPNKGPSMGYLDRQPGYKEGLSYYYEVGQA